MKEASVPVEHWQLSGRPGKDAGGRCRPSRSSSGVRRGGRDGSGDLKTEVVRLSLELEEATEEKLQAARYGLVVLEESAALKTKHRQLEEEHETLKVELQQLKEVGAPQGAWWFYFYTKTTNSV